jgi:site-specific recombinase XerD
MDIHVLSEKFCDYSTCIRGYSKNTIRRYKMALGYFAKFSKIREVEQVSQDIARDLFFHGRLERKWSVNTFLVYRKSLSVFFEWCVKEGHLKSNPIADMEIPKLEKKLPPKLNRQDALRLLEVAYNHPYKHPFLRQRSYAVIATFLFAGLRKQELLNLQLTDVDLANRSLFVRQGKGSKDRVLPMGSKLLGILQAYLVERQKLGRTCPEFFTSRLHNIGLTNIGIRRLVEQITTDSGISFTIHKLRHTFATLMLEGGCDIYSLSRMMGHDDIKTTTIYLAASAEHLRSQIVKHPLNS